MKPLNILRIIPTVDPKYGGPVEAVRTSAAAMGLLGHTTEVLTLDDPTAGYVESFPVPVHGQNPLVKRYGYTPKVAQWIMANSHRFDAAIIEGVWNHASIGGWQGLRAAGLPYVIFTHGMLDPWFRRHYPIKHVLKQAFWLAVQGRVLRDASLVLFTCKEEQILAQGEFLGHKYDSEVVPFGTADVPLGSEKQKSALLNLMPKLYGRKFLLFLSRLHPKKGPDILIRAFANVADQIPHFDLVMAGPDNGGLMRELQALAAKLGIASRVHWPGMLEGDAKWGAYREASAFILSSHSENFGIVVAEALACGTPVLISNKVNIWREVEAAGAGFVENDDVESTARMIAKWTSLDDTQQENIRSRTRRCFENHFHVNKSTENLLTVLSDIRNKENIGGR